MRTWIDGIDPARAAFIGAKANYDDRIYGPCRRGPDDPPLRKTEHWRQKQIKARPARAVILTSPDGHRQVIASIAEAARRLKVSVEYLKTAMSNAAMYRTDGEARPKALPGWRVMYAPRSECVT